MVIIVGAVVVKAAYTSAVIVELYKFVAVPFSYNLLALQVISMGYSVYNFFRANALVVILIRILYAGGIVRYGS